MDEVSPELLSLLSPQDADQAGALLAVLQRQQQEQRARQADLEGRLGQQTQQAGDLRNLALLTSMGSNPLLQGLSRTAGQQAGDLEGVAARTEGLLGQARAGAIDPTRIVPLQQAGERLRQQKTAADAKAKAETERLAQGGRRLTLAEKKAAASAAGAKDKAAKEAAEDTRKIEAGFRKEILQGDQGKKWLEAKTNYQMLEKFAANPSPANSMAIVFAAMKSLDPDSVVKEGEQVQVRNTTNLPGQLVNYFSKVSTGNPLNPEQVKEILDMGRRGFSARTQTLKELSDAYRPMVEGAGGSMKNVMPLRLDLDVPPPPRPMAAPVQKSIKEKRTMADGTEIVVYTDGTAVKRVPKKGP